MKESSNAKPSLTEQVFTALQTKRALGRTISGEKPVMFADIVRYVMGNDDQEGVVYQAICNDLSKRRMYQQALNQSRFAFGKQEAHAQSAGEIELRQGEGFTIKLKFSRANANQCYVILLLDESLLSKSVLADPDRAIILHISDTEQHKRLQFPPLLDGKSQLMMLADDERLILLKNINTELSLC